MARMQGLPLASGNRALLVIAALAGLAAAVLFVVAVNNSDSKSSVEGGSGAGGNSVVAVQNIPAGSKIEATMLAAKKVPDDLLVANAFDDPAKVVGQVAAYDITAGEQITPARIGAANPPSCKTECVVPKGMVGVGLAVKDVTAAGGLLLQGDRVDVVAAFEVRNDGSIKDCGSTNIVVTQTILQNVEVLAVGQQQQDPAAANAAGASDPSSGSSGTRPADAKTQPGVGAITLAVTPEDGQKLISAQERSKSVWASMRRVGDNETRDIPVLVACGAN